MDDQQQKDQRHEAQSPAPVTKEKLSALMNSFLDQLIASTPPATVSLNIDHMGERPPDTVYLREEMTERAGIPKEQREALKSKALKAFYARRPSDPDEERPPFILDFD
jgi:hypothetical protein